jgi:hypothetical protein
MTACNDPRGDDVCGKEANRAQMGSGAQGQLL